MGAVCLLFSVVFGIIGLLVLAVAFVIGFAVWTGLCLAGVFACRPEGKRWPWVLLSIPLYLPVYLIVGGLTVWVLWPDDDDYFEYAFNRPPGKTVVVYDAEIDGWCDSETNSIHFSATPADIQQLTAIGLTLDPSYASTTNEYVDTSFGKVSLVGKDIYTGDVLHGRFYSEDGVLIYDPATGEAWYEYIGVD